MLNVDINKTGFENVLTLVEANNPGLPFVLDETTVVLEPVSGAVTTSELLEKNTAAITLGEWVPSLNRAVALASNRYIVTSTDLKNWEDIIDGGSNGAYRDLTWSTFHGCFYAVGSSGLSTSTDGLNWSAVPTTLPTTLNSIAVSKTTGAIIIGDTANLLHVSLNDGVDWVAKTDIVPTDIVALSQTVNPSLDLFALKTSTKVIVYDSISDTLTTVLTVSTVSTIAYSEIQRKVVISSSNGFFYTSTDMATSLTPTIVERSGLPYSLVYWNPFSDEFIAKGAGGPGGGQPGFYRMIDENTIISKIDNLPFLGYPFFNDGQIVFHSGWLTVSTSDITSDVYDVKMNRYGVSFPASSTAAPYYDQSTNKTLFTGISNIVGLLDSKGNWEGILGNLPNGTKSMVYVAGGFDSYITSTTSGVYTSTDLKNWTLIHAFPSGSTNNLQYIFELNLFIAYRSDGIYISTDLINWTQEHVGGPWSHGIYNSVLNELFVCGNSGNIARSTDGQNWTIVNVGNTLGFASISFSTKNGVIVVGQSSGPGGGGLMQSSDGSNWTSVVGVTYRGIITYNETLDGWFYIPIPNNPGLLYSKDLTEWVNINPTANSLSAASISWDPVAERYSFLTTGTVNGFKPVVTNDSSVIINALLDSGYSGSIGVNYYRPSIVDTAGVPEELPVVLLDTELYDPETPEIYEQDALVKIAATLGMRASELRISTSVPVPMNENDERTITVVPKLNSYVYSGGSYTVTVAAIDTDVPLTTIITFTDMDGFTF